MCLCRQGQKKKPFCIHKTKWETANYAYVRKEICNMCIPLWAQTKSKLSQKTNLRKKNRRGTKETHIWREEQTKTRESGLLQSSKLLVLRFDAKNELGVQGPVGKGKLSFQPTKNMFAYIYIYMATPPPMIHISAPGTLQCGKQLGICFGISSPDTQNFEKTKYMCLSFLQKNYTNYIRNHTEL